MTYQTMLVNKPDPYSRNSAAIISGEAEFSPAKHSADKSKTIERNFPANTTICDEGEERELVLYLIEGIARVSRTTFDGNRIIVAFLYPGEMFAASVDGECRYNIETLSTCKAKLYPWTSVTDWVANDPMLAEKFINENIKNTLAAHQHLVAISQRGATQRLCSFLVKLAERQRPRNGSLTVRLAIQRDIADYLGLTVETVSRQLTMLKDKGIVKRHDRRTLEILDMEALIDLSGEPDPLSHHFEHGISVAR